MHGSSAAVGRLLQPVLLVPRRVRPPGTVRFARRAQRPALRSSARCPTETRQAFQGEQEGERVPEAERLELHHVDAHRRRFLFPRRRDPTRRSHRFAHFRRLARAQSARLQHHQRHHPLHQFLYIPFLSNQLRHLLRHESPGNS